MKTTKVVGEDGCVKGKLPTDLRGQFEIRKDDILRRIQEGTLPFDRVMLELQAVAEGRVEIIAKVDLDADPFIPEGWKVESHTKGGKIPFRPNMVDLYLSEEQQKRDWTVGNDLCKKVETKNPYNANLLDFFLAHPELIPKSWKGKAVYFWGTIYCFTDGSRCVRSLFFGGDRWSWGSCRLVREWSPDEPAAVPNK
ncbi:MAG: hypothetical protein NTU76_02230 [Candidatus Taylorbacteria bacterium]|nr:hypothetical protein [Candidatus Taylorbacteria bacterium]